MKTYIKDNVIIKRFKKGMIIQIGELLGFSSSIAFTEEEIEIIKEYFMKEIK